MTLTRLTDHTASDRPIEILPFVNLIVRGSWYCLTSTPFKELTTLPSSEISMRHVANSSILEVSKTLSSAARMAPPLPSSNPNISLAPILSLNVLHSPCLPTLYSKVVSPSQQPSPPATYIVCSPLSKVKSSMDK